MGAQILRKIEEAESKLAMAAENSGEILPFSSTISTPVNAEDCYNFETFATDPDLFRTHPLLQLPNKESLF